MVKKIDQELVDRIRHELDLPNELISDTELWESVRGSFMAARINFSIKLQSFFDEIKKVIREKLEC